MICIQVFEINSKQLQFAFIAEKFPGYENVLKNNKILCIIIHKLSIYIYKTLIFDIICN